MSPRPDISAPVGSRFVHGDTLAYDSDRLAGGRTGAFTNPGRSRLRDPHHRRVTSYLVNIRCETTRNVGSTTL